jgi:hypothetical protein
MVCPDEQATQLPPEQTRLATHWDWLVQLVRQAVEPQMKGVHCEVAPAPQAPAPLQVPAAVAVPLEQVGEPQLVLAPG